MEIIKVKCNMYKKSVLKRNDNCAIYKLEFDGNKLIDICEVKNEN